MTVEGGTVVVMVAAVVIVGGVIVVVVERCHSSSLARATRTIPARWEFLANPRILASLPVIRRQYDRVQSNSASGRPVDYASEISMLQPIPR